MPEKMYNEYDYCEDRSFNRNDYPSRVYLWNDIFQYIKDNDYNAIISDDDGEVIKVTIINGHYRDYTQSVSYIDSTFETGDYYYGQ